MSTDPDPQLLLQRRRSSTGHRIDPDDFKQGNTWLVCQNNDFVFKDGYDGPLMPGMIVMYQTKAKTEFLKNKDGYGIDRYFYKIEKMSGDDGEMVGTILETSSCIRVNKRDNNNSTTHEGAQRQEQEQENENKNNDDDDMSDDEEVVNIKDIKGKLIGDALQVDYPLHARGVMQCYTRISKDSTFEPKEIKFNDKGEAVV